MCGHREVILNWTETRCPSHSQYFDWIQNLTKLCNALHNIFVWSHQIFFTHRDMCKISLWLHLKKKSNYISTVSGMGGVFLWWAQDLILGRCHRHPTHQQTILLSWINFSSTLSNDFQPLTVISDDLRVISDVFVTLSQEKYIVEEIELIMGIRAEPSWVCIPQKSLAIAHDFWNENSLGWTLFRTGDGFFINSDKVYISAWISIK